MKKILLLVVLSVLAFGKEFYTDTKEVSDPDDLLVVVNKFNYLPKDYKPSDLVYIDGAYGNKVPIRSVLKDDFLALQTAAKDELGITLMPTTAFRDQNFQKVLYDKYVKKDGVKAADTYSARPGYSEHQTGLAIDIMNAKSEFLTSTDVEYDWLVKNSYKYGFILRYPKDKETITGYMAEEWHFRYVGKDVAKVIYDDNITYDEYTARQ